MDQIEELSNFSVTEYYGYKKVIVSDARRNDFVYLCMKVSICSALCINVVLHFSSVYPFLVSIE